MEDESSALVIGDHVFVKGFPGWKGEVVQIIINANNRANQRVKIKWDDGGMSGGANEYLNRQIVPPY
ncbi:MAG: hypothetical protein UT76_C0021G0004 [Candidatus Woesebacteria bacterium GW2011_GWB1_40_12]|uniref:Uncharacterized protein n=1 Tax=Candidatus Woesebacteria bacterium GW2011_GWB1_40_12 TaxID=1618576 RepID=A0A0G0T5T6_9BACT|nr:MAG: hypothetical protein UT76_C0021G0004 [Candidatus Woesebacteria bacterium GW2011_GWB1_40_12]